MITKMPTNNSHIMGNQTNVLSLIMLQIFAFIILCNLGFFITESSAAQKFYPNGRYGRRSVLPPLMGVDNTDDAITFIGNIAPNNKLSKRNQLTDQTMTLLCYYTGVSNLLRCTLRQCEEFCIDI
ncbi:unnamed protein product [Medioppia subpectinata]|uniref:Uncharacterized protein n=1 Tax=Medioppia subpectinata TaxID=1979941 RepID=A0A7R9KN35_9ACAR|nr:unnamed protein product [Medioppia subpectinata]CAG2106628.1 unnamed protein product [Medioppia subpectinata]